MNGVAKQVVAALFPDGDLQIGPSSTVSVQIDLARIRANAEAVCRATRVPLIAVVKADGYGLGARRIAETIGDLVEAFYVFRAS